MTRGSTREQAARTAREAKLATARAEDRRPERRRGAVLVAAGLDASTMEGTATHFHSHLDILVDGRKVTVPANIGIDTTTGAMSELHSHDTSGVLHVESPSTGKTYTLGQLFTEWGVRLDARHLGGLTAEGTTSLTAWVDGTRVGGDPSDVRLTPHRQFARVYGPTDAKVDVPSTYRFSPGE